MVLGYSLGERVHIDWWRVITDLERAELSHAKVAEAVGMSKGWVAYLKDSPGAEPRHSIGVRLLQLWVRQTGMPYHDAPER